MKNKVLIAIIFVAFIVFAIIFFGPTPYNHALVYGGGFSIDVEVARTQTQRTRGLSGRASLSDNAGMLFVFDNADIYGFWMKGMKIPIDIVWIRDNIVVGITEQIYPQIGVSDKELTKYYPPGPVTDVLELRSGRASELGIYDGSSLNIQFVSK